MIRLIIELKRTTVVAVLFVIVVLSLAGCTQKFPPDLPKLYPCEVRVLFKGEPLGDAFVGFAPAEGKWAAMGTTNEQGIASLKTNFLYKGVAKGSYKVIVTKYREELKGIDRSLVDPDVKNSGQIIQEISLLDDCFKTEKDTPLAFVVETKKKNEATFEVW